MTNDESGGSFDGQITSEEAFEATLNELIATACENGVEPVGSWVCRNGKPAPDMEVMVVELDDQED
jgi:hypothetical protein